MQPRTLDQVLSELNTVYQPQIESIRQRQSAIPGQVQAEEQGLQAKQERAYGDILNGARRRGTGVAFGGIPLQEQAKYSATEYMPALARLKESARQQAMSLEDAILGINERRTTQGQQIYMQEQQAAEQRRQFEENLRLQREQMAAQERQAAAARAAASAGSATSGIGAYLNALSGRSAPAAPKAPAGQYGFKNGKDAQQGFFFTDAQGRPISAAKYAQLNGMNPVQIFQKMAQSGDIGAMRALKSMRGPGFDNATKSKFSSLFWGA